MRQGRVRSQDECAGNPGCERGARRCLILAAIVVVFPALGAQAGERERGTEAVLPATNLVVASTVPSNGDLNPYGVEFVPGGFSGGGALAPGDLLVSNFNDSDNLQGTGTTIVKFSPDGNQSLFFQGNPGLGLTTALEVLKRGFVLVGNFPAPASGPQAGNCLASSPGSILVIDSSGKQVDSITSPVLNGPWDSTIDDDGDKATLFVSSALTGSVLRFELAIQGGSVTFSDPTVIASGYVSRCDPATFVVAPTGLVYDRRRDRLFVASTGDNAVFAVDDAAHRTSSGGTGNVIFQDPALHGALAMVRGPLGHLFVSNNDGINPDPAQPSAIVEFTDEGMFLRLFSVDAATGGAFGLNFDRRKGEETRFAFVDDVANVVTIWTIAGRSGRH